MGPTKVAEIQNLPNVVIKVGRAVKFFLCDNGHIEPWLGEDDGTDKPWRPCRSCSARMVLTTRRIRKDGSLAVTTRKPKAAKKVTGVVKVVSEKTLLARFVRNLTHPYVEYKVEYVRPDMIRVTRKGDTPKRAGGRIYKRFVEVTMDAVGKRVLIDCFGVSGWFEDFRVAGKKCKLQPVAKFYPPLSGMIAKSKTAKGGR